MIIPRGCHSLLSMATLGHVGGLLAGAVLTVASLCAVAEESVETQVKAAIIVKLTKFVEWPAERLAPAAKIKVCLLGDTPLGEALTGLGSQLSQSHALEIVPLRSASERQLADCHVLYLGESEMDRLEVLVAQLRRSAVLTVGDSRDFAEAGGMIELVRRDSHMAFRINLKSVKVSGLVINSQLLSLATIVE